MLPFCREAYCHEKTSPNDSCCACLVIGRNTVPLVVWRRWSLEVARLKSQIADQQAENERLLERNRVMEAEVVELKQGMETVEERARHELGMVKEGETLYLLME